MRFIRWLFRDAFLAEYNAGYRDGSTDTMRSIARVIDVPPNAGLRIHPDYELPSAWGMK